MANGVLSAIGTPGFNPMAPDPRLGLLGQFGGAPTTQGVLGNILSGVGNSLSSLGGPLGQASVQARQNQQQLGLQRAELSERIGQSRRRRQAMGTLQQLLNEGITPENQQEVLGLLGQISPDAFTQSVLGQLLPEQRAEPSVVRIADTLFPRGSAEWREFVEKNAGKGTTINIGKENEPISINDINKVRVDSDGDGIPDSPVPIGTTPAEARAMGAQVVSTGEQKSAQEAQSALAILDRVENLAVGPTGIFQEVEPGFINRASSALDFALNVLTQDDPRAGMFKDLSEGTVSRFVRTLGESGALNEGDVQRALGLLPRIFPLPDTGPVARSKLRELRAIINKGVRNMNRGKAEPARPGEDGVIDLTQ